MKKINVFLCDDHKIVVDGLISIFKNDEEIIVSGYALNSIELFEKINNNTDIILMDINVGESDGVKMTKLIREKYPRIKIIALSMYQDSTNISRMVSAGANGYIFKNISGAEIISAIKIVHQNKDYFSGSVLSQLIQDKFTVPDTKRVKHILSDREIEVLKLILEGQKNQKIATNLFISVNTMNSHRKNIMRKLKVKTTAELIKYALENNLV